MAARTRRGAAGYGTRRCGSFAGKTATSGGGGRPALTHVLSRHGPAGHGIRRAGAFGGKTSGGGGGGGGGGGRPSLEDYTRLSPSGVPGAPGWTTASSGGARTLSDADVAAIAAGVWQYVIEAGLTAEMISRILLSFAAGNITGGPDQPRFASVDGTRTRIGGSADEAGNRTRSALDGSA